MTTAAQNVTMRFVPMMLKLSLFYLVIEAAFYGGVPIALGVQLHRVILPVTLLFIPILPFGSLLFLSYRNVNRPRIRCLLFAAAVCALSLLGLPALVFWALSIGVISASFARLLIPQILIASCISTLSSYYLLRRRVAAP